MTKLRSDWIASRLPELTDADNDLDVCVLMNAAGDWHYMTYNEVQPGWAWHHTDWWKPQA